MRRIVVTFGLIAGAIMGGLLLLTLPFKDQIGFDRSAYVGYTAMVLAFLMTYVGMRTYRDTVAGGAVTYGKALQVGLLITLVATIVYVACWEVAYYVFMPDFAEQYGAYAIAKAQAAGKSAAEIATLTTQMQAFATTYRNPLVNIGYTFLEPLPVGLLFSFVSAWLVSRKRA